MAGIGFVLRKLTRKDDLLGILQGFAHSAMASNGPWLFTVLALGGLSVYAAGSGNRAALEEFRTVIIYNFAFSLVLSGPLLIVLTRVLADAIYAADVRAAPSMLVGATAVVLLTQVPFAIALYFGFADLAPAVATLAVINLVAIGCMWLVSIFLSALKDYRSITHAFLFGMGTALGTGIAMANAPTAAGLLLAFTLGLVVTVSMLLAKILAEYPYAVTRPFAFLPAFRPYWLLALSGFAYNAAIWVDKFVMWTAPEAVHPASGLVTFPQYDSAMFLAYLTITPSMAIFMMIVETRFYEAYIHFFRELQRHANLEHIRANHRLLVRTLVDGVRNMMVIQGTVSLAIILLAPQIFEIFGIDFLQLGIFRLGVLGSLFQVLILMLLIVLAYFDFRAPVVIIQAFFLAANAAFAWASLQFGFAYYGYGFFLACLLTFIVAYAVTARFLADLPYQTFVRHNASIRG
ncbi:MAG: exopolysaccharide Pel transporter PelG [Gammaproteobacteria bacterium]|nr:exopolysaccharide Pel transporter PelG [Gammaproteobacteria bacterium]MCP5200268.1 exopolysaccharide Pel transporter PelG [Gammaproteobacteria bacterium]